MTTVEAPRPAGLAAPTAYTVASAPYQHVRNGTTKGKALIVVDMQNDFVTGVLKTPGAQKVVDSIKAFFRLTDAEFVVTTQDWHVDPGDHFHRWPPHAEAGTYGAQLVDGIDQLPFDGRFFKGQFNSGYSGFDNTGLETWLRERGVTEVEIVGLALDYCVSATAQDAKKLGFKTRVLLDHTAAADKNGEIFALATFQKFGIEAV